MKKAGIVLLVTGAGAILLSLVLAFAMVLGAQHSGAMGIVGGADGPTFWFLYNRLFRPVAGLGVAACIAGVILLVIKNEA